MCVCVCVHVCEREKKRAFLCSEASYKIVSTGFFVFCSHFFSFFAENLLGSILFLYAHKSSYRRI